MESSVCRAKITLGSGHLADINVTVSPASARNRGVEVGLGVILDQLDDPNVAFAGRPILTEKELDAELERASRLFVENCGSILRGDFAIWDDLRSKITESTKQYKKGGEARRVWLARQRAFVAFGQGNYREAASSYESIRKHLTQRELKKLEYAKTRL